MQKILSLGVFYIVWLIVGTWVKHNNCCNVIGPSLDPQLLMSEPVAHLDQLFQSDDYKLSNTLAPELSKEINNYISDLRADGDKALVIIGLHNDDEINNSIFNSLGIARANQMKALLMDGGASQQQIKLSESNISNGNLSESKGLRFILSDIDEDLEESYLSQLEEMFSDTSHNLYFQEGSDELDLSDADKVMFTNLLFYMDLKPSVKVDLIGHTDNKGSRKAKMVKGKKQAEKTKSILVANGFESLRLSPKTYGPDKPIVLNNNRINRSLNNRIELKIQE